MAHPARSLPGSWEEEIEPLLQGEAAGKLKAATIIEWLEEQQSRPVQRIPAAHPATTITGLAGAKRSGCRAVYFPQEHPPRPGSPVRFTHGSSLKVTKAGQPYRHQLLLCN